MVFRLRRQQAWQCISRLARHAAAAVQAEPDADIGVTGDHPQQFQNIPMFQIWLKADTASTTPSVQPVRSGQYAQRHRSCFARYGRADCHCHRVPHCDEESGRAIGIPRRPRFRQILNEGVHSPLRVASAIFPLSMQDVCSVMPMSKSPKDRYLPPCHRKALIMTETELRLIASAAKRGESNLTV